MKIKRFHGRTMREALRQVREEQGPDSVILSKQKVADGIEVIAAVDYDEALLHQSNQPLHDTRSGAARPAREPESVQSSPTAEEAEAPATAGSAISNLFSRAYASHTASPDEAATGVEVPLQRSDDADDGASPGSGSEYGFSTGSDFRSIFDAAGTIATLPEPESTGASTASPGLDSIAAQLNSLQATLENRFNELHWDDLQRQQPQLAEVIRRLDLLGLERTLVQSIVRALTPTPSGDQKKAWRNAIGLLAKRIPIAQQDTCDEGGIFQVVGPTGSGKTTSIAKLAARFALENGPEQIGLITTDGYRIGAQEHLLRLGKILGVPVQVAANPKILRATLDQLADKKLILIDTAGFSLKDETMFSALANLTRHSPTVQTLLTLPANMQMAGLRQSIRTFDALGLDGAIVTKVDEATSMGELLSAVIEANLTVCYVSDGQRVPEDLKTASRYRAGFVSQAVSLAREYALDTGDDGAKQPQHPATSNDQTRAPLTTTDKRIASYG